MKKSKYVSKILKKYKINRPEMIALIILSLILFAIYCFILYYENNFAISTMLQSQSENTSSSLHNLNIINTAKNCILVIFSIVLTSLLSALFIDTKSKNNIVSDLIVNDVFSNCEFYSILEKEHKQKVLVSLENDLYFSGKSVLNEMYSSIRQAMIEHIHDNIYLDNCSISIRCKILGDCIEKDVYKTVGIKSYDKSYRLVDYPIATRAYSESVLGEPFSIKKLVINGEPIDIKKSITIKPVAKESPLEAKNGYTTVNQFVYNKILDISNKKETKIQIHYYSRVPLNDKTYTCRMPYACKSLVFDFALVEEERKNNYRLNTVAFGFIDDAKNTPNISDDKLSTRVTFNNWIFPNDGVTVTICENF